MTSFTPLNPRRTRLFRKVAQKVSASGVAVVDAPQTETETLAAPDREQLLGELRELQTNLATLQGESPLILPRAAGSTALKTLCP